MITHCFKAIKEQNFIDAECVQDVSNEHFKEVSCELSNLSNFEEHVECNDYVPRKVHGSRGASNV